jgi:hypothetical protein
MPVLVTLSVSLAPSLLQAHRVEELALVLWGGWSIGMIGGGCSAWQTHSSWRKGSEVNPLDIIMLELCVATLLLAVYPTLRSQSLVALVCGMLAMSSIVIELVRSRICYESLIRFRQESGGGSGGRSNERKEDRYDRMAIVATVAVVRHSVLVDILASFAAVILCLSLSEVNRWAATKRNVGEGTLLEALPDLSLCFGLVSVCAFMGATHFAFVRNEVREAARRQPPEAPVQEQHQRQTPALQERSERSTSRRNEPLPPLPPPAIPPPPRPPRLPPRPPSSSPSATAAAKTSLGPPVKQRPHVGVRTIHSNRNSSGRSKRRGAQKSLHVISGRWLAFQAAVSLQCLYGKVPPIDSPTHPPPPPPSQDLLFLYLRKLTLAARSFAGGRYLVGSLYAAYYVHLPPLRLFGFGSDGSAVSSSFSSSTAASEDSRDTGIACNVLLWSSALVGALLATNVVARWTAGRHSHLNDVALTRINILGWLGVIAPPLVMCVIRNRAVAWIGLVAFSGFNGFTSVVSFAAYSRRLSLAQTTRVSTIKAAANGASGLIPFACAALWTSGFDAAAAAVASSGGGVPVSDVSASTMKFALMLVLVASGLIPLGMLLAIYRQQKKPELLKEAPGLYAAVPATESSRNVAVTGWTVLGSGGAESTGKHPEGAGPDAADDNPFKDSRHRAAQGSDSEDSDDDDLESFFMDYRLRRQRQRLWEAAAEVEAQMALLSDDDGGNESEGEANETTNEKSGLIPGK